MLQNTSQQFLKLSNLRHTRSWRWYLMERLARAMWCLQVTPRCIDMAQETEWMNEWSPKAWSWQLKNHHYNKLKFGETERESCVYSSTEVFVPRDMSDLARCWQISNTRTKSGALIYFISPLLPFSNLILLKSKFSYRQKIIFLLWNCMWLTPVYHGIALFYNTYL
jgi:hypothetical protein